MLNLIRKLFTKKRNLCARERNLIDQWETQAKEKLADIIKENLDVMNGYEFDAFVGYSASHEISGWDIYRVRVVDSHALSGMISFENNFFFLRPKKII